MEQRQYRDHYLPFAAPRLMKYSELIAEFFAPAGNYKKPGAGQAALFSLLTRISEITENSFGPTLAFSPGGKNFSVPIKWRPIIQYLEKEKLINVFDLNLLPCDMPRIFSAFIFSDFDPKLWSSDGLKPKHGISTHGRTLDLDETIARCIGEFLERFPLMVYKEKDFLRACVGELEKAKKDFLNVKDLNGFSNEQKLANIGFQFDERSDFLWAQGRSFLRREPVLIPAQLIFWNYNFNHQSWSEAQLAESNTSGAGGHYTLTQAILAGAYELIQRDGFLIYWLNRQPPPKIFIQNTNYAPLSGLLKDCRRMGFEVEFYNTTTDVSIPSCLCGLIDHSGVGPKITVGGGCGLNWDEILFGSLIEAVCVNKWTRDRHDYSKKKSLCLTDDYKPFFNTAVDQIGRVDIWADEKMVKNFDFFRQGKKVLLAELKKNTTSFSASEEELNNLINIFKSLGPAYEIFYYQAKHKILNDLGYCSVKVIIPPLVPLYLREIFAPLGAKRLKEVPEKLGFEAAREWNSWPHPFP